MAVGLAVWVVLKAVVAKALVRRKGGEGGWQWGWQCGWY